MKFKLKNDLLLIYHFLNGKWIKILLLLLFFLSLAFAYNNRILFSNFTDLNMIDGFISFFKSPISVAILFLFPMLFLSIYILYCIEKFGANLMRFEKKEKYIQFLISSILKTNTIFFIIVVFFIMFATCCMISPRFMILYIADYKTINLLYFIVFLFKIYLIGQWLSIASILFIKMGFSIITIIFNLIIYYTIFDYTVIGDYVVSSVMEMPIWFSKYLYILNYKSFTIEILCFIVFAIILLILFNCIYFCCIKKVKNVGGL